MPIDRARLEALAKAYYEACNAGDIDAIAACFVPGGVHYFPAGSPQGTFVGARAIADGWREVVDRLDSRWTIDHLVTDEVRLEVAIEWTHWKPAADGHLRGIEICCFRNDGLITEIRAAYAAPVTSPIHEYGGFPYQARGYAMRPPPVRPKASGLDETRKETT